MRIKTNVKAGSLNLNHNQTLARARKAIRIKSGVKAGGVINHNQTLACKDIHINSGLQAGPLEPRPVSGS
jgi:hypothetical protein